MRLLVVLVAGSMVAVGELTISGLPFRVIIARTLEIPFGAAFAAAEQEREEDQDQYTAPTTPPMMYFLSLGEHQTLASPVKENLW